MAIVARAPKLLPVFLYNHPLLHCCVNHSQHRIYLQQHLPIIKAQYLQTQFSQRVISRLVFILVFFIVVLTTIEFDHQFCSWTIKIHNECEQWFLTIELHALYLLAANVLSQHLLCIGQVGSERAGESFKF